MDTLPAQKFQLPNFFTDDPFGYMALLTFSLTSNAKTVLTKILSNPMSNGLVKSLQARHSRERGSPVPPRQNDFPGFPRSRE
jgi:hypothetical protein